MAEILIERRQPVGLFLKRRAARILPLLWTYVALVVVLVVVVSSIGPSRLGFHSPLAAAFFFQNYLAESDSVFLVQHSWSLAVEEHSYLLLAAVAALTCRGRNAAAAIALSLATLAVLNGVRLWLSDPDADVYIFWRTDVRAASVLFSFGLYLALRPLLARLPEGIVAMASPVSAVLAVLCLLDPAPVDPLRLTACTLLAAVAVNTIEFSPMFRAMLSRSALVWLGTLSFSLYIWQQPFFMAFKAGQPALPCLALAIGLALLSYKRLELPARVWLNQRWNDADVERADARGQ